MLDKDEENSLRSLIERVKTIQTTQFSGFASWHRGYDEELTREDGPFFQLYAGLGVLARDMYLYLEENPGDQAEIFDKIVSPLVKEDQKKYPGTTIFQSVETLGLPEGYAEAAVGQQPTLAGLDDWRIVREKTTKPGKRVLNGFVGACREQLEELCGPGGPYEKFRKGKVNETELGMQIAAVFQDQGLDRPQWSPLVAFLSVTAIRKEFENICERMTILFIAAEPTNANRLRLGQELREIEEQLQLSREREKFHVLSRMAARTKDLTQAMLEEEPNIVHFSGHGTATGALAFEDESGRVHPVKPRAMAAVFKLFEGKVGCVVLNACYTEPQAKAIAQHVDTVIGTKRAIGDKAAIAFAIGFYQALGAGRKIDEAYEFACAQMDLSNVPEHLWPMLVPRRNA